jgi:two-component sensor histidine kinase
MARPGRRDPARHDPRGIGLPFYAVDRDWRIYLYNAAAERHFGRPASQMIGTDAVGEFPQDRTEERGRILHEAMARRATLRGETLSLMGRYVSYVAFPLGDGLGVFVRDVTDRRNAEKQRELAEEALRKRSTELEAVLETIPTGGVVHDRPRDAQRHRQPPRHRAAAHAARGRSVARARPADRLHRVPRRRRAGAAGSPPAPRRARRDGAGRAARSALRRRRAPPAAAARRALRNSAGELQGAVCAAADVTERHRYEEHLKLLLNELNHRVKNTLAIVQSIASLTLKDADAALRAAFEERLLTLSAAHNLLTDESWTGADLVAVVRASLRTARERIRFEGPDMRLRPKSAVALSMALHELGTNALKYGALSAERGAVTVRWSADGGRFRLLWQESGGPPVSPPARRGFGSRMIERGLAAELQGEVRIDWRPDGVVCTIDAPLDVIHDGSTAA